MVLQRSVNDDDGRQAMQKHTLLKTHGETHTQTEAHTEDTQADTNIFGL